MYTINALNNLIEDLNDGVLDKSYQIDWQDYRNSVIPVSYTHSEPTRQAEISYAVFCLKKKKKKKKYKTKYKNTIHDTNIKNIQSTIPQHNKQTENKHKVHNNTT